MKDFEEEIAGFKTSLEVESIEDVMVKADLSDKTDIMMELLKGIKEE